MDLDPPSSMHPKKRLRSPNPQNDAKTGCQSSQNFPHTSHLSPLPSGLLGGQTKVKPVPRVVENQHQTTSWVTFGRSFQLNQNMQKNPTHMTEARIILFVSYFEKSTLFGWKTNVSFTMMLQTWIVLCHGSDPGQN